MLVEKYLPSTTTLYINPMTVMTERKGTRARRLGGMCWRGERLPYLDAVTRRTFHQTLRSGELDVCMSMRSL